MPRLENWTLTVGKDLYGNTYQKLIGNVYGHPKSNPKIGKFCDGNNVMTSEIVNLNLEDGIAVTRSGTIYELGVKSNVDII